MREYDGIHESKFPTEICCDRVGQRGQQIRPKEKCAGCSKRQFKFLKQPQRQERLRDETARECIEAEQTCELVDNSARSTQRTSLLLACGMMCRQVEVQNTRDEAERSINEEHHLERLHPVHARKQKRVGESCSKSSKC